MLQYVKQVCCQIDNKAGNNVMSDEVNGCIVSRELRVCAMFLLDMVSALISPASATELVMPLSQCDARSCSQAMMVGWLSKV